MKRMHPHPINILENTSRYLILLLLPLLRALATTVLWSGEGLYAWLSGAWFDLMILGIMLGLGIYKWFSYTFSYDKEGIYVYRGIIVRQARFIAYSRLTAVSVEAPWYYLPIRAVRVNADTDGGPPSKPDFSVTTFKWASEQMMVHAKHPFTKTNQLKRFYIPSNFYVAVFSLLTSNSITGVLYLSTSVSQIGDIFGQDFEDKLFSGFTKIANVLAFGLPPAAAIIGYTILGCWFVSFCINLLKHMRFEASRRGRILEVKAGLLTRRQFSIAVNRINCLSIRQSLMSKLFGFFSVFIQCTGYGKAKNEMSVLIPAGEEKELKSNLAVLLPELPLVKRQIKPKLVNMSRFLVPPGFGILCVLAVGFLAIHFLPSFRYTLIWLTVILEIPFVWWFVVKVYSYFFTGIGTNGDVITIYYTYGYRVMTCSMPKERISKIEIYQSPFQLTSKCCDVTFCPYAEGQKRQRVVNMNLPEVRELLGLSDEDLGIERWNKFTFWK